MEITGKLVQILEPQRFTSRRDGSEIVKNYFVIETQAQYPKKVAFSVIGEDKFKQMSLVVGGLYNVSFDVESREWQGKWFTDAVAWRAIRTDAVGQQQQQQGQQSQAQATNHGASAQATQQATEQPKDDLPF